MNVLFAQQITAEQQQRLNDAVAKAGGGVIGIAGWVVGLLFLVLLIIIIVKMFQNNSTALGIVTIITTVCCGIGPFIALIFGWIKSSEWNIRPLMMAYTVVLLLYFGIFGYMMAQIWPVYMEVVREMSR